MKKSIQTQINNINDALAWLKVNKPDQYEQRFLQLVNERCRLRKLAATELENPAIAAYGESQKGKSYVITNLLSDNGRPFTIATPEREYDFVKEINPITNNVEATGVVTRFTTFSNEPGRYNPNYPVLIKLLGISEIATILCDGYHSDITDYQSYSDKELNDISTEIYEAYRERPELASPVIVEDDILDMKYYLQRCTGGSTQSLIRSPYFDRIALIARRVEASEWSDIFAPLWHRNATLTRLFRRLSESLRRLSYARNVYLPVDAVLNTNQTLMSVQRINELGTVDKTEDAAFTKVVIRSDSGDRVIERFDKSELSALCAEAVFKVEERFLNSELSYDMTMIDDPAVKAKLPAESFKKDIIRHTDLLDFPGARARNQLKEENLDKTDSKSSMTNDANVYLRGKVAYLFNRYSDSGLINILLFCHDNAQRNDDTLYITIENWVKQYVGETSQQRARTLNLTGGVSPFFLIATKFNIDMTMADANADDVANSRTAIDQRWADRFNIVLYKEVIHGNDAEWFKNWIAEGETFKNTYLLRDYKYSGDTGKGNNLYTGFRETGREQKPAIDPVYYERMRTSFIESPHTRKFFADPACSWDVAATQNNDGALYLFQQLAIAASNMEMTRRELTAASLKNIGKALYEILKGYYHANDAAAQLIQDINQACAIRRELIFACNRDSYFFGRMIRELQITEKELYNSIYDLVNSSEMNDSRTDARNYEIIRKDIGRRLDRCTTDEMKWECVMMAYNLPDRDAAEKFLADKGVDAGKLFAGNFKRKTNSAIIAENVYNTWIDSIKKPEAINRLCDNGKFDPIEMSALVDNIEITARKLQLEELLDKIIEEHVKVMNVSGINLSLIADLMASKINGFICDLGYDLRTDEEREAAVRLVDDNPMKFDPLEYIGQGQSEVYSEEELTEMFDRLIDRPDGVTQAFENNYFKWIEYMIVSFLLKGTIINYDIEANKRIGQLIERIIK
ncbi:MAG: hypothetical protein HDS52_04365 [Barnesiella sp.]|nr:hypothetical protein [Barnesiella sp.]